MLIAHSVQLLFPIESVWIAMLRAFFITARFASNDREEEIKEATKILRRQEMERLLYVAVTRARHTLVLAAVTGVLTGFVVAGFDSVVTTLRDRVADQPPWLVAE